MPTEHHVYAICAGSPTRHPKTDGQYLQALFTGSRQQCQQYVKGRVRSNLSTHFLHVSSLGLEAAGRRLLP